MNQNEYMSQDADMGAQGTQGTATNRQVWTAPTHNGHGEFNVDQQIEEEKGEEEASTLSSWGVSAVQRPQPVGPKQLMLPPTGSHHHPQALEKEDFDRLLFDIDTIWLNDEENLDGYDGENYEEELAMANPPETIGVMQTAYASEESQE